MGNRVKGSASYAETIIKSQASEEDALERMPHDIRRLSKKTESLSYRKNFA